MRNPQLRLSKARPTALFLVPLAFLAVFFAYPLAVTFQAAGDASAWAWLSGTYARTRLLGAVGQATLSTVVALALAVPLAWHHHVTGRAWTQAHLAFHAAPFVLPVFVVVAAVREVLGPNGWVAAATGTDVLSILGPLGTVVVAHAFYNYGFAARILHAALERRPHHLEEAAQVLGATPRGAFLRVSAPLLMPTLLSVALLVWLFSFSSFGVVLLLGEGWVATPETMIYQNLAGAFPQEARAAVLGVAQLLLNVALLTGYFRLRRREARLPRRGRQRPQAAQAGRPWVSWAVLGLALAPLVAVLAGGFRVRGQWTLDAWRALFDVNHPAHLTGFHFTEVLLRSVAYAVTSALVAVALAVVLGYGLRAAGRLRPVAEGLAALPLGTSSILLGLGYLLAFGAGSWLDLRGAWVAIMIVHSLIAFPFVARVLLPALDEHDRRLDEAAALLGASPASVAWRIHWPLLRGSAVAALGFAGAMSLGDFGASLLLARRETMTLAVWIGEHDQPFRSLMQAQSVALTAVLMLLAAGAYLLVERFDGRRTS